MHTITEIEDAIINTLEASAMNDYCKKIASYQLEGGNLEEQIRIFAGQVPCVLILYSQGTYTHRPNRQQEKELTFSILVCSQSMRGQGQARRGAVGTYQMLDDLKAALTGNRCGLEITGLAPTKERAEINTKLFSAYSLEFKTTCRGTY